MPRQTGVTYRSDDPRRRVGSRGIVAKGIEEAGGGEEDGDDEERDAVGWG